MDDPWVGSGPKIWTRVQLCATSGRTVRRWVQKFFLGNGLQQLGFADGLK